MLSRRHWRRRDLGPGPGSGSGGWLEPGLSVGEVGAGAEVGGWC